MPDVCKTDSNVNVYIYKTINISKKKKEQEEEKEENEKRISSFPIYFSFLFFDVANIELQNWAKASTMKQ